jgi:hypothetical protein
LASKENEQLVALEVLQYLLLLFAQKKEQEKGTPLSCLPAADTLCFSMLTGR